MEKDKPTWEAEQDTGERDGGTKAATRQATLGKEIGHPPRTATASSGRFVLASFWVSV